MKLLARGCRIGVVACAAAAIVSTVGCGDGRGRVYGTVKLNGETVTNEGLRRCSVTFTPVSGSGALAVGSVDESGEYRLATGAKRGVEPGEYFASVRIREVIPPKQEGGYPQAKMLAPPRYANPKTSGLRFTVKSGGNRFDIEMNSGE